MKYRRRLHFRKKCCIFDIQFQHQFVANCGEERSRVTPQDNLLVKEKTWTYCLVNWPVKDHKIDALLIKESEGELSKFGFACHKTHYLWVDFLPGAIVAPLELCVSSAGLRPGQGEMFHLNLIYTLQLSWEKRHQGSSIRNGKDFVENFNLY